MALRGVGVGRLASEATKADPIWLAAATGTFAAAIAVRAWRWWLLFPETRPSLRATGLATLVGYLFNNLLPARAGEAARLVALRRTSDVSGGRIAGTIVGERIIDTAVLLVLFVAATPLAKGQIFSRDVEVAALVGMALVSAALGGLAHYWHKGRRFDGFTVPDRLAPHLDGLVEGLTMFSRTPATAAATVTVTAISWLLLALSNWLLLRGFDLPVSYGGALVIALATGLAMIIPSAPASLGVFEATTVLCLGGYPVTHVQAVTYAVALHAMNVIPLLMAGALAMLVVTRTAPPKRLAAKAHQFRDVEVCLVRVVVPKSRAERSQEIRSADR
jgi:glycosyltransferase 2 family protein